MKQVTVTGASGHIGANLVRALIQRGYQVRAMVRQTDRALKGLPVETVDADILNPESLRSAFKGSQVVYHLAACISIRDDEWDKLQTINVDGTSNVIEACQLESVPVLVHFSSIHALDQHPLDVPVDEARPLLVGQPGRGQDYDLSKAEADRRVRAVDSATLATRLIYPTAVIGPGDFRGSLMGEVIRKLSSGRLPALVAGGFDWVDVRDVAQGAIDAAEKGAAGDRYLLSGHYRSMRQFAEVVSGLSGVPAPRFTSPIWLARTFSPLMSAWASLTKESPLYTRASLTALQGNPQVSHRHAATKLSYQPRRFQDTVRDALEFYAEGDTSWSS